jgi:hypothetical protein
MAGNSTRTTAAFWPIDGKNRAHIPHMPMWQGILRISQAVRPARTRNDMKMPKSNRILQLGIGSCRSCVDSRLGCGDGVSNWVLHQGMPPVAFDHALGHAADVSNRTGIPSIYKSTVRSFPKRNVDCVTAVDEAYLPCSIHVVCICLDISLLHLPRGHVVLHASWIHVLGPLVWSFASRVLGDGRYNANEPSNRVLEFLTMLWWLVSFALLADVAVRYARYENTLDLSTVRARGDSRFSVSLRTTAGLDGFKTTADYFRMPKTDTGRSCAYAAAALASLLWALFIVSLTYLCMTHRHRPWAVCGANLCLGIAIHRHRTQNRPAMGFNLRQRQPPSTQQGPRPNINSYQPQMSGGQRDVPIVPAHTGSTSPSNVLGHPPHDHMGSDSHHSTSEHQMTIPIYPPNTLEMKSGPAGTSGLNSANNSTNPGAPTHS